VHGQAYGVEFFSDLIDYKDKADAAPGHQIESERYREKYVGLTVNKMMGWMSRGASDMPGQNEILDHPREESFLVACIQLPNIPEIQLPVWKLWRI